LLRHHCSYIFLPLRVKPDSLLYPQPANYQQLLSGAGFTVCLIRSSYSAV